MKILVTGGAGYIGSHCCHQLVEAGHEISVLDNLYSGFKWAIPSQAVFFEGEIADQELVKRIIKERSIEAVMHFAAHIEVPESITNPLKYYRNNLCGSQSLIQSVYESGVKKFIFSSTAAVYGNAETAQVSETSSIAPLNSYGRSKWMTEQVLEDLSRSRNPSDFNYICLRYFNVAGARLDGKVGQSTPRATHLIKTAAECATGKRAKMFIYGTDYPTPDGTGVRDYIHVEDLVSAHLLALDKLAKNQKSSSIFNCGYGHGFSVRQVIEMMKKVSQVDFKVEEGARRDGDSSMVVADARRIRDELGWKPQHDNLEVICRTAFEWEKNLEKRLR
jgi:UDP-glucose 4-epimerase